MKTRCFHHTLKLEFDICKRTRYNASSSLINGIGTQIENSLHGTHKEPPTTSSLWWGRTQGIFCDEISAKRKRTRCSATSSRILSRELNALHRVLVFSGTTWCTESSSHIFSMRTRCTASSSRVLWDNSIQCIKFLLKVYENSMQCIESTNNPLRCIGFAYTDTGIRCTTKVWNGASHTLKKMELYSSYLWRLKAKESSS